MYNETEDGIKKLSKATRLDEDQLKYVFHFDGDGFTIIAPIKGNQAEKQLKATLCTLTVNDCMYGKNDITSGDLRSILEELGIGSLTNLSTNLRSQRQFIIAKNSNYKLTHPGKAEGLNIIRELYGKNRINEVNGDDSISLHHFKSGQPYTSKKELSNNILSSLKGELKLVDPYCGERTLDLLKSAKNNPIKVLTNIKNLGKGKNQFINDLKDFKKENPTLNLEVRTYSGKDLHDRYIISSDSLVLIGHSIKDLGSKESFAIKIDKKINETVYKDLNDNFDKRWENSTNIV